MENATRQEGMEQYDAAGAPISGEKLTETFTYGSSGLIAGVERTLS